MWKCPVLSSICYLILVLVKLHQARFDYGLESVVVLRLKLTCGTSHYIFSTKENKTYSYGLNNHIFLGNGMLGIGASPNQNTPQEIIFKDNNKENYIIKSIGCGEYHSIILFNNNKIYSFGCNG